MKKKIILITEYLNGPYDEGIKKTVYQLYILLKVQYDLKVICRIGPENENGIEKIKTNRLFISRKLMNKIRKFEPEVIIYFPFAALTFSGFLRCRIISEYFPAARNIIISLQPKPLKNWQKGLVKWIRPELVLTPSSLLKERLDQLGIKSLLIPLYTNLVTFVPIRNLENKMELRKKYKIPINDFVVTHIGHLNTGRNLDYLIPIQNLGYQIVVVGSSSTPSDAKGPVSIKEKLIQSGIIVIEGYIEKIQEIYQLSDLYIFPVVAPNSSIGLPLSVMEARACGIPVLTTDFGSIRNKLNDDYGNIFYSNPDDFVKTLKLILKKFNHLEKDKTDINKLNTEFLACIASNI
jgi:glycosyltransferase involved in cell wall biosynthesis